jgi:hypothetical protein
MYSVKVSKAILLGMSVLMAALIMGACGGGTTSKSVTAE